MKRVSEKSRLDIVVSYLFDNVKVTPSAARYRIDCLETGAVVSDWLDYTPAGTSDTLTVTPTQNQIINTSNRLERKQLVVEANPQTDDQFTDTYDWIVENKRGIS